MNADDLLKAAIVHHDLPRPALVTPDGIDVEDALRKDKFKSDNPVEQFFIDFMKSIYANFGTDPDNLMGEVELMPGVPEPAEETESGQTEAEK